MKNGLIPEKNTFNSKQQIIIHNKLAFVQIRTLPKQENVKQKVHILQLSKFFVVVFFFNLSGKTMTIYVGTFQ